MVFRKRKDAGGTQGYDRISQLIEDRQRELAADPGSSEELEEEDTILLNPAVAAPEASAAEKSVSLFGVRGPAARGAEHVEASGGEPSSLPLTAAEPYAGEELSEPEEDETPFARTLMDAPAWEAPVAPPRTEAPAMRVPDLGLASRGGTLIAVEAVWEGTLRSEGDVRVEGVLRGEIDTAATLVVAPGAQVHGTIRARSIMLGGDVEGDVTCDERLEILPGGSARGQINSGTLVVHEGAYIDSRFQMRRDQDRNA